MIPFNSIEVIDCLEGLKKLPDECVQTCITSPPFYRLRDYNVKGQVGMEPTPAAYIARLVEIFTEVKRVLCKDGTVWLNLGDTYNAHKATIGAAGHSLRKWGLLDPSLKNKDLIGIPWRVALALQSAGYYLRQDLIWHKPNPMPESVKDRCTKAHEYIFLLTRSERYYFDQEAIKQPLRESSKKRLAQDIENQKGISRVPGKTNGKMKAAGHVVGGKKVERYKFVVGNKPGYFQNRNANGKPWKSLDGTCNKRSVWVVANQVFKENHFATFPEALIKDCVKAGSRTGDLVLDPFMGAGTTALVAVELGRNYLGFELNAGYKAIAQRRLRERLRTVSGGP